MYRMQRRIVAVEMVKGQQRGVVMIPEDAVVESFSIDTVDSRMTDIRWEGRQMAVFTEDLEERGAVLWEHKRTA